MELTEVEELDRIWRESDERPVVLFKHSTRCPVSSRALDEFEKAKRSDESGKVGWVFLDLIAHRDCSEEIARRSGITHQSPQAILLRGGAAVWSATHFDITSEALCNAALS